MNEQDQDSVEPFRFRVVVVRAVGILALLLGAVLAAGVVLAFILFIGVVNNGS